MESFTTGAPFEIELPKQVGKLLAEPSGLHEFRQWFRSALWDAESSASEDILTFAYRVENLLAILDSGMWSTDDFLSALREESVTKFGDTVLQIEDLPSTRS